MKATFENSVNVLVKAYLNDSLEHFNCHACAVGNIIAAANGFQFTECKRNGIPGYQTKTWDIACGDYERGGDWYNQVAGKYKTKQSIMQIKSSGYNVAQLRMIEKAFERVTGLNKPEKMFNGLMAVVDVLAEIHSIDLTTKESAKLMFVKP